MKFYEQQVPPFEKLFDLDTEALPDLPDKARELYGRIWFPPAPAQRPYTISNFVQSIDGAASYAIPQSSGGGVVSGSFAPDRWVMDLFRTFADAIMAGSETFRAEQHWQAPIDGKVVQGLVLTVEDPEHIHFRNSTLGKSRHPINVTLTGRGEGFSPAWGLFHVPDLQVVIFTTAQGESKLRASGIEPKPGSLEIIPLRAEDRFNAGDYTELMRVLRHDLAVERLMMEGGPRTAEDLRRAGLIDEELVTRSPRMVGGLRPKISEGQEGFFPPQLVEKPGFRNAIPSPQYRLVSLKRNGDYIFERWRRR